MTRTKWLLIGFGLAGVAMFALRQRPAPAPMDAGIEPAGLESQPVHELRHRNFSGGDEYLVRNLVAGPIEVECRLAGAQNVEAVPPLPRRLVVPAASEARVTEFRSIDPRQGGGASIACTAVVGDPGAGLDQATGYVLPFHPGTEIVVDQGFGGPYSHRDIQARHSLDFSVPEGTPVLAARAGVVMQVEQQFRGNGVDAERFGGRANYVRILHDDGSMAIYAHLFPGSAVHRPGERIPVGRLLGKSGNTGFSTGPHLHFSVQRNVGMELRSIPFTMAGVDADNLQLAAR